MSDFREYYLSDMQRYGTEKSGKIKASNLYLRLLHYFLRAYQFSSNELSRQAAKIGFFILRIINHIEISPKTAIGKGLYLGHPYCITINPNAKIGENCNIHKGVLIGQENRGARKGTPIIGNKVWIGINAVIVGKIKIGDDVLIAPNSYVNCDVPDHSVVIGNPCKIIHKDNATESYINNITEQ